LADVATFVEVDGVRQSGLPWVVFLVELRPGLWSAKLYPQRFECDLSKRNRSFL